MKRIINQMYMTTVGIYGVPLAWCDNVFLFVLLGRFWKERRGKFFIDFAIAVVAVPAAVQQDCSSRQRLWG
jgi:TRAP-type uncharacterized transport system fused permease subunit